MVPPTNKFILTSKELDSEHYLWFINARGGRCQSFPYVNVTIALPCEWNFCKENGEVEIGNLWLERKKNNVQVASKAFNILPTFSLINWYCLMWLYHENCFQFFIVCKEQDNTSNSSWLHWYRFYHFRIIWPW